MLFPPTEDFRAKLNTHAKDVLHATFVTDRLIDNTHVTEIWEFRLVIPNNLLSHTVTVCYTIDKRSNTIERSYITFLEYPAFPIYPYNEDVVRWISMLGDWVKWAGNDMARQQEVIPRFRNWCQFYNKLNELKKQVRTQVYKEIGIPVIVMGNLAHTHRLPRILEEEIEQEVAHRLNQPVPTFSIDDILHDLPSANDEDSAPLIPCACLDSAKDASEIRFKNKLDEPANPGKGVFVFWQDYIWYEWVTPAIPTAPEWVTPAVPIEIIVID